MEDPQQLEFESILDAYPVRLTNFEGPLDLLLHLIKTNEVNIYDIPIALITSQYIEYIDLMQEMNLDVAGEFLVMAATLIHIKSRMLLPRPDPSQEDPEEDPREALVRRLLEHQKFKADAELLHERETLRSAQWTRAEGTAEGISSCRTDSDRRSDRATALAVVGDRGLRVRGFVRRRADASRARRDVSGAARDDPVDVDSRIPER